MLGLSPRDARERFERVIEFAELEEFVDLKLKNYSSGMQVRLAFSVAVQVDADILLVDEVLAVGDAAFQRKSLAKMNEVAKQGRTVVFVSHNLAVIQALCKRGILLEAGRTVADAPVSEAIDQYLRALERSASQDLLARPDRDGRGWQESLIKRLAVRDPSSGQVDAVVGGRPASIVVEVTEVLPMMECRLTVVNSLGNPVTTLDSELSAPTDVRDPQLGACIECEVASLPLIPGRYRIDAVIKGRRQIQDGLQAAAFFDVEPGVMGERPMPIAGSDGDMVLAHTWHLPE
jgi:lipopolysaccharide transport system ATP-binding protein